MIVAVLTRLKQAPAIFKQVGGAAAFAMLEADPPYHQRPACWVLPIAEQPGANRYAANAVAQDVVERIALVCCLGDGKTAGATIEGDPVRAVRDQLVDRLVGWSPEPEHGQVLYGGGRLLRAEARAIYWQFEFTRVAGIRKV